LLCAGIPSLFLYDDLGTQQRAAERVSAHRSVIAGYQVPTSSDQGQHVVLRACDDMPKFMGSTSCTVGMTGATCFFGCENQDEVLLATLSPRTNKVRHSDAMCACVADSAAPSSVSCTKLLLCISRTRSSPDPYRLLAGPGTALANSGIVIKRASRRSRLFTGAGSESMPGCRGRRCRQRTPMPQPFTQ
jgi:hypothetical protein